MRKKRNFTQGAYYHVTSRTNDKIRVFENKLDRKIMLLTLESAKDKFRFRLANFCIMPTHIHLLIAPGEGTTLSPIMQWIKTRSAKSWNSIHGSTDHLWGNRFFAREIRTRKEYNFVMNYIDQNPVVAGLSPAPQDWKASGTYYKANKISGLVDLNPHEKRAIKLLSPIPPAVSRLLPPAQLEHTLQHYGAYAEEINRLYATVKTIPQIGDTATMKNPPVSLHYRTDTADYFITEYDKHNTLYGIYRMSIYPHTHEKRKFPLSELKSNPHLKLDLSWQPTPLRISSP